MVGNGNLVSTYVHTVYSICACSLSDHLDDISYSSGMTVQEIPATVTDCKMSLAFWPKLEPKMLRMVPPSFNPVCGSN